MTAPFDACDAIAAHCDGIAGVATGHLDAPVVHCPGWHLADLLRHLAEVHWFWATVVAERLEDPPGEERRPAPADDAHVVAAFREGAAHLVATLRAAPDAAPVWTWAPAQRDVGFVRRHQVQEAAVHHWDAAHAAGVPLALPAAEAADAVDEFLTFSIPSAADPATPPGPALGGRFALVTLDTEAAWTIADGDAPGTVRATPGRRGGTPALEATASDLLLWLYGRVPLAATGVDPGLLGRFRALCATD